ncbi:hypothetical protein PYH37_000774 [Sinorhizobium numidicum]|uniref:hypothetical protein n=1 Tax=Sinorhizobium numidicum TaxID=680248 RepID=UPI002473AC1A|nr:hypothetical protein [Sinorhizobium numidicum]WEX75811.1 hypothetical protein PYH37_000774 [Sinorhizobium numidicum]
MTLKTAFAPLDPSCSSGRFIRESIFEPYLDEIQCLEIGGENIHLDATVYQPQYA